MGAMLSPLPEGEARRRVEQFIRDGRSGQVIFNLTEGHVASVEIHERVKVDRENGNGKNS